MLLCANFQQRGGRLRLTLRSDCNQYHSLLTRNSTQPAAALLKAGTGKAQEKHPVPEHIHVESLEDADHEITTSNPAGNVVGSPHFAPVSRQLSIFRYPLFKGVKSPQNTWNRNRPLVEGVCHFKCHGLDIKTNVNLQEQAHKSSRVFSIQRGLQVVLQMFAATHVGHMYLSWPKWGISSSPYQEVGHQLVTQNHN